MSRPPRPFDANFSGTGRTDASVGRNVSHTHTVLTTSCDGQDINAKLAATGHEHDDILPAAPLGTPRPRESGVLVVTQLTHRAFCFVTVSWKMLYSARDDESCFAEEANGSGWRDFSGPSCGASAVQSSSYPGSRRERNGNRHPV